MKAIYWICWVLVIVGGINVGLGGLFGLNLISTIFGVVNILPRIIYILIGIAAVIMIFASTKCHCKVK